MKNSRNIEKALELLAKSAKYFNSIKKPQEEQEVEIAKDYLHDDLPSAKGGKEQRRKILNEVYDSLEEVAVSHPGSGLHLVLNRLTMELS